MEMEKQAIKISLNLAPEDLMILQKQVLRKSFKPHIVTILVIAFILMLLMILTSEADILGKLLRLAMLVFIPVLFAWLIISSIKKSAKKAFEDNKLINQTQNFILSEDGLQVESASGYSNIRWEDLYTAEEAKEGFLFFISKQQAYVISKKHVTEAWQQTLMRSFVSKAPIKKSNNKVLLYILIGFGIFALLFVILLTTMMTLLT